MNKKAFRKHILTVLIILTFAAAAFSQEPYKLPPKEIIDILDAPPLPRTVVSSSGKLMLLIESESMPSISYLAQPVLRIAGIRINPDSNSRQILSFNTALSIKQVSSKQTAVKVDLPPGIKFFSPSLSPDEKHICFLRYLDDGLELWSVEVQSGRARKVIPERINSLFWGFEWLPDSRRLIVSIVPENRGPAPQPSLVPVGPNIQETSGKFTKAATFQDLIKTPHDEKLFEYYALSELAIIDLATGELKRIAQPGIYEEVQVSPDMNFILINRIKRPYSYSLPYSGFAHAWEIRDLDGNLVRVLADLPPAENVPINGVPTGPRNPGWMAHKPATLIWIEALDDGDPEKIVPFRDQYLILESPFKDSPREMLKLKERASGLSFLMKPGLALVSDFQWKKQLRTTYLFDFNHPEIEPKKIFELNIRDRYNDPGQPVTTILPKTGERVIVQDQDWIFLSGPGASPKGDYPFLDKFNFKTMKKERLFRSQDPAYETFVAFADEKQTKIITSYETRTIPPNYFLVDLKTKKRQALTDFKDPAPQLTAAKKELIRYKREDGVELSGTLYLPADYKPGERRPVVVWAYPIEYTDPTTASQVRGSANRFTFFRGASHLFFLTQGYVVLDNAEMPVIGDPKTVNDTFVKQIVANASAAIKSLADLGVGDPNRVGVGGHSYGAFMTANLLAHCDLFAAGIARSGAYNRTLTPFGFQSERRTLWEAKDTYINMSPFMHADKINEPILIIHGEADNNSGTFPIQSERLFAALKGFGATARLVMLPNESHGYAARESIFHVVAEMLEWFNKYVKNKKSS